MFSWNVNYGKFQNPWPRDKFSFTLFSGTGNLLALPSEHRLTFQSPRNWSQMAVSPGPSCLGPSQPCQSSELPPWVFTYSSSSPQPQVSKVALKKVLFSTTSRNTFYTLSWAWATIKQEALQVHLFFIRYNHHSLCSPVFYFGVTCFHGGGHAG